MKLHCIGSLMALSLPWGSVMAFSLRWAGRGLYQYLYGVPWYLYGFITAMEGLYDFITAMGALYGFITHMGAIYGFFTAMGPTHFLTSIS